MFVNTHMIFSYCIYKFGPGFNDTIALKNPSLNNILVKNGIDICEWKEQPEQRL